MLYLLLSPPFLSKWTPDVVAGRPAALSPCPSCPVPFPFVLMLYRWLCPVPFSALQVYQYCLFRLLAVLLWYGLIARFPHALLQWYHQAEGHSRRKDGFHCPLSALLMENDRNMNSQTVVNRRIVQKWIITMPIE